jgi:hypothetical protein
LQSSSRESSVTFYVRLPYRDLRQVAQSTVKITSIGGSTLSVPIPATAWTVDAAGVATAKFDRVAVINFMTANGFRDTTVVVVVEGQSLSHNWRFFASDSTTTKS